MVAVAVRMVAVAEGITGGNCRTASTARGLQKKEGCRKCNPLFSVAESG